MKTYLTLVAFALILMACGKSEPNSVPLSVEDSSPAVESTQDSVRGVFTFSTPYLIWSMYGTVVQSDANRNASKARKLALIDDVEKSCKSKYPNYSSNCSIRAESARYEVRKSGHVRM